MPVAKIHVCEGKYDEARLGKVSRAVQDALMSALGVPPEDFFQIFHILPRSQFLHTPSFLGLKYSDDLISWKSLSSPVVPRRIGWDY
jgi:4-oxalocrotonate tautomerase